MSYTLIRNATAVLELGGRRFLIDPMLDPAGARGPVENTPQPRPNPLVDLPDGWEKLIADVDAVVVTHLHRDHFDATAERTLDAGLPVFCQPEDAVALEARGFADVRPVEREAEFDDVVLSRTLAQHGTGEIGMAMSPASGFVLIGPGGRGSTSPGTPSGARRPRR